MRACCFASAYVLNILRNKNLKLSIENKLKVLKKEDAEIKKKTIASKFDISASRLLTIIKNRVSSLSVVSKLTKPAKFKRNRKQKWKQCSCF